MCGMPRRCITSTITNSSESTNRCSDSDSNHYLITDFRFDRKARGLFESVETMLTYLDQHPLLEDCHIAVLAELHRYQEAAEIHVRGGRLLEAIDTLLEDRVNEASKRRANDYILQGLWESTPFRRRIKGTNIGAQRLLQLVSKVVKDSTHLCLLSPTQKDEASPELLRLFESTAHSYKFYSLNRLNFSRVCANLTTRPTSDSSRIASSGERRMLKRYCASTIISSSFPPLLGSPMRNSPKS